MGSFSFEDLCGQCVANNLVFPALEAFEQRLDNPTNYYLFYEYFLSAAVGEEEWKQNSGYQHRMRKRARRQSYTTNIISPEPMTRDRLSIVKDKRMSTSLNEAFTLILFKNNYFAWLLEAKQNNSDLVCDYDVNTGEIFVEQINCGTRCGKLHRCNY